MTDIESTIHQIVPKAVEAAVEYRENLAPEKEYIVSLFVVWAALTILVNPDSVPREVQPMLDLLNKLPTASLSLWLMTVTGLVGSVDGARRIALEQLPLYKAYLQVFLLNRL